MTLTTYYTTLLQATFSGTNDQVKDAESELRFQFRNDIFLQTMSEVLLKSNQQTLQLSTTNILKEYSKYLMNNHQQSKLSKYVETVSGILRHTVSSSPHSLSLKILLMLSDNLKMVFTLDPIHQIRMLEIKSIIEQFQQIVKDNYTCEPSKCFYLALLTRSMISSPSFDSLNNSLFKVSFDVFAEISSNFYLNSMVREQILSEEGVVTCGLVSDLFFFYLKRSDIKTNATIQSIVWSQKFQKLFFSAISFSFLRLVGIYSQNTDKTILEIMKIQANTFELIEIVMRHRLNEAYKDKLHLALLGINNDIIEAIRRVIAVGSLKMNQSNQTLLTLTKIIRLFETMLRYKPHAEYFHNHQLIYKEVIFPLLEIPATLKQAFADSPDAFINFFNYVFDSSMIDDDKITDPLLSLKTSVAQMLIMSIEFVGILESSAGFALQFLGSNPDFEGRSICLIILGIMSYNLRSKSDILREIRPFLEKEMTNYSQAQNDIHTQILQVLTMMLISKFTIPICNSEFSKRTFEFIVGILRTSNSEPHRMLALQILMELIKLQGDFMESRQQLMAYLITIADNPHQSVRVLDILYELYASHPTLKHNYDLSFKVVQHFVKKIKESEQGKDPLSLTLSKKYWNTITEICSGDFSNNQELMLARMIEKEITVLFPFLAMENFGELKESIFSFNIFLLTKTKQISAYQSEIVMNLGRILASTRLESYMLYEFLMMFIHYGYQYIENSLEMQEVLFLECAKSTYVLYHQETEKECQGIKGITLLEILLLHSNKLNPPSIEGVVGKICDLIETCHVYYTFTKSNLVGFLALALVKIASIKDQLLISRVLNRIIDESDCVTVDFASKVYVLSLCTLLKGEALSPNVRFNKPHILITAITKVLTFSLNNTAADFDDEETQYFENVQLIFCNIPKIDQVQTFKSIMLDYKISNPDGFRKVVEQLSDLTRKDLSGLLRMQFVHSTVRQIVRVDRSKFVE